MIGPYRGKPLNPMPTVGRYGCANVVILKRTTVRQNGSGLAGKNFKPPKNRTVPAAFLFSVLCAKPIFAQNQSHAQKFC